VNDVVISLHCVQPAVNNIDDRYQQMQYRMSCLHRPAAVCLRDQESQMMITTKL